VSPTSLLRIAAGSFIESETERYAAIERKDARIKLAQERAQRVEERRERRHADNQRLFAAATPKAPPKPPRDEDVVW